MIETYYLHDLIKDFAYAQFDEKKRKKYNRRAAEYFLSIVPTPENILLAYYHLKEAEKIDDGIDTLQYNWEIFDLQGHWREYVEKLREVIVYLERKGSQDKLSFAYNAIGYHLAGLGEIDEALEYFQKALEIRVKLGDKRGIATQSNNIGMIYKDRGDLDKALEYYQKALEIGEELGDKKGVATRSNNIGMIYVEEKDLDKAIQYFKESLKLYLYLGNPNDITEAYQNLIHVYSLKGDKKKASEYQAQLAEYKKSVKRKRLPNQDKT